jgi:hypothetical protein
MTNVASGLEKADEDQRARNGAEKEMSVPGGANGEVPGNAQAKERGLSDGKDKDMPPNGGYGWVCVGCVAVINAVSSFPFLRAPRELQCLLKNLSTLAF